MVGGQVSRSLRGVLLLLFGDRVQRQSRMCVGAASPHLSGNPDCLHDLLFRSSRLECGTGMSANAVRTLSHMRHRHGDQLLSLRRKCSISKHAPTESLESLGRSGSQTLSLLGDLLGYKGKPVLVRSSLEKSNCSRICGGALNETSPLGVPTNLLLP